MIWVLVAFAVIYISVIYWLARTHPELFKDDNDNDTPFFPGY